MSLMLASYKGSRSCLRQVQGGFVRPLAPQPNPLVRRDSLCQHGNDSQSCDHCKLPVMPDNTTIAA